jgi:glycosyltransferase involved in cell wall biosynthesis
MIATPKVSVIIPTYGRTDFLSQAIDSAYEQTFTDFEILVVDDNDQDSLSRKKTKEIVDRHRAIGREMIYIQHERNRNGAVARNTGFRESSGKYISFLDADDMYYPTRLEEAVAIMDSADGNVGGVYTGVEFRRRGKTYAAFKEVRPGNFLVETLACQFKLGTGSNLFLRRSVVEELGGFDEAFWRHQDYEFMVRFFESYQLAATSAILVVKNNENFNLPEFSISLKIKEQFLRKYRSVIEALPKADQDYIIRSNYVWLGEMALREKRRCESGKMYRIADQCGGSGLREQFRRAVFWLASWLK